MAIVKWLDRFETGISFIGDDHKPLIGIIQKISGPGEAVRPVAIARERS